MDTLQLSIILNEKYIGKKNEEIFFTKHSCQ